ncbi:MAG: hypothetical protein JSS81_10860 [Acidobacteria bacterium]|nr:hypothetical protein [Acidobacteriota bacterium]
MIKAGQIEEILALYKKHGWRLRRVLLSDEFRKKLGAERARLFGELEIHSSAVNGLWFSRSSKPGQETWELRRLSATPYALLEVFDLEDEEEIREEALLEIEGRMAAHK